MWLKLKTFTNSNILLNTDYVAAIYPNSRNVVMACTLPTGKTAINLPEDQIKILLHYLNIDEERAFA